MAADGRMLVYSDNRDGAPGLVAHDQTGLRCNTSFETVSARGRRCRAARCRRSGPRSGRSWAGCRWGAQSDIPTMAKAGNPADPNIIIQSLLQHSLMISDMPPTPVTGGIILKSTTNAMIVVNDSGIYIDNGKGASIMLVGPNVTINKGALVVI